jgi:3-isopropylmalate/(R)-2-methylmalate dehydratase large subunit
VHIIGPELGLTQPGKTIVCGDSHTSTHGAFGALAFGIGSTEVGYVLATQCLLQKKPKTLAIEVANRLPAGVTAKDLILAIIGKIGVSGGTGHVIEYRGEAIRAMSMEQRMTVCNMTIEGGARAGMIAPDDTTFAYLKDTPRAPKGAPWEAAVERWRQLPTDVGARFDRTVDIDAAKLEPMITYGTNPGMVVPISQNIPDRSGDPVFDAAMKYMGLRAGEPIQKRQSTSCSSAAAPTGGFRTCARRHRCSRATRSPRASTCSSCRVRRPSSAPPRPKGCTMCSARRAQSGANRAVRCASA